MCNSSAFEVTTHDRINVLVACLVLVIVRRYRNVYIIITLLPLLTTNYYY